VDDCLAVPAGPGRAGGSASASPFADVVVADAVRDRPCRGPPHRV